MQLSIPGKTFLVGEYLVLHKGPCLVALTGPAFHVRFFKKEGTTAADSSDFHPESPAGLFIRRNANYFNDLKIIFEDKVRLGGLGASTAQFLAVYAWKKIVDSIPLSEIDLEELLASYLEVAFNGKGTPPSGADLVGQLKGHLCFFNKGALENRQPAIRQHQWPFSERLYLLHTGHKLSTHEHLREGVVFDSSGLQKAFDQAYEGLLEKDAGLFCDGMNAYATELESLGLTCANSVRLLKDIRMIHGVKAAKACGALGVDVLAIVCDEKNKLMEWAPKNGLKLLATDWDLCGGIQNEE